MSGAHAAAHAAQEKKKREQEEEEMTRYTGDELSEDFEFKIVRSATGAFSKREKVEQVISEEAAAGWKFVEKFDDNRMRFKRPASARRNDFSLPPGVDPYRTTYGLSEGGLAFTIFGSIAVLGGLIVLFVWLFGGL
ncbi:MAG: hypothetical protein JW757_06825 [Anaerolineales bacterium]|nr:hypothetical protein [Anaerolineales bacterium]